MFLYRWRRRPVNQHVAALRVAEEIARVELDEETLVSMSDMIRGRTSGRGFTIGSNDITAPMIEQSFKDGITLLEKHL